MDKQDYKKKYNKIKKNIKRDFKSYDKEFSLNELTGYFQVEFIIDCRIICFTILPNCIYSEFKQKIEKNLYKSLSSECKICFDHNKSLTFCKQCSIEICIDCFQKIKKSSDFFSCPQCRYVPYNETKKINQKNEYNTRQFYRNMLELMYQNYLDYYLIKEAIQDN